MTRLLRYFATGALLGQIACGVNIEDPKVVEDLDGFIMRLVDGEWFYTLNNRDDGLQYGR